MAALDGLTYEGLSQNGVHARFALLNPAFRVDPALPIGSEAEELGEFILRCQTDVLTRFLSAREDEHGRDAADAVLLGDFRGLVDVEFADLCFAFVLVGELIDDRRQGFAGAAPRRGEIHEDGLVGLQDLCVEIRTVKNVNILAGHGASFSSGIRRRRRPVREGLAEATKRNFEERTRQGFLREEFLCYIA